MFIGLHVKYRHFCYVLMRRDISRRIPKKFSNTKYNENLPIGTGVVLCGRTDRQDEASSRLPQFCEKSLKRINKIKCLHFLVLF